MSEKVIALVSGLGESDQKIVLSHLLELATTQRHLQTELTERGYFKWDFMASPITASSTYFTASAAAAAATTGSEEGRSSSPHLLSSSSSSPALIGRGESKTRSSTLVGSLSKAFSRSKGPRKGYEGGLVEDTGGLYVNERGVGSEKTAEKAAAAAIHDAHLASIKEVWRTFNVSDEVIDLEEKGATSQVSPINCE